MCAFVYDELHLLYSLISSVPFSSLISNGKGKKDFITEIARNEAGGCLSCLANRGCVAEISCTMLVMKLVIMAAVDPSEPDSAGNYSDEGQT